jgi:hypothetical protein
MKTNIAIMLCLAVLSLAFVFGCTENLEVYPQAGEEEQASAVAQEEVNEKPVETIYTCPMDIEKINYNCEKDDDCKMVACRGGAGEVYTCVGSTTEYEGAISNECVCKEMYEYTAVDEDGIETTATVKECRHI